MLTVPTFEGALHLAVNKTSLIKQKIKGGWADPNPMGGPPQEKGNIVSV